MAEFWASTGDIWWDMLLAEAPLVLETIFPAITGLVQKSRINQIHHTPSPAAELQQMLSTIIIAHEQTPTQHTIQPRGTLLPSKHSPGHKPPQQTQTRGTLTLAIQPRGTALPGS